MIDNSLFMSDAQAVTSSAASTNSLDFSTATRNIGNGRPIEWVVLVGTTCTASGSATVTPSLQDSADNSSFTDVMVGPAIAKATLVAGYEAVRFTLPHGLRRYIQTYYTVATGPLTAGTFSAFLELDRQDNVAGPSGFTVL